MVAVQYSLSVGLTSVTGSSDLSDVAQTRIAMIFT